MKNSLLLLALTSAALFSETSTETQSLYNGLDPGSISQHLALYKLYPSDPAGQQARAHLEHLLNKSSIENKPIQNLPIISDSINGFVSFMLGKELQSGQVDDECLDAIEALSANLKNRSLIGRQAKSEKEILNLSDSQIDLARAILLAQQESEIDWPFIRSYEAQIDFLALQVLARLSENAEPKEIIQKINHVLFFENKIRFPNQYIQNQHHKFSQLTEVLDLKQGVCLGTTIVYLCLAQRLGLPLEIITPPGHIFVRHNDDGQMTNIETTHRGVHVPSDNYHTVNLKHLKQINYLETVSCVYLNLGTTHLMDEDFENAQKFYLKALKYNPKDALITMLLGYSYAFDGKHKLAKNTFKELSKLSFDDQITPIDFDAYKDYLKNKISLKALKAAVLPPKESKLEILKERQYILEQELTQYPKFCAGWHMLSNIYNQLSEPQKAIDALMCIHNVNAKVPMVELNLALLYNESLNVPASWEHFQNCERILKANGVSNKITDDVRRMLNSSSIEPTN